MSEAATPLQGGNTTPGQLQPVCSPFICRPQALGKLGPSRGKLRERTVIPQSEVSLR